MVCLCVHQIGGYTHFVPQIYTALCDVDPLKSSHLPFVCTYTPPTHIRATHSLFLRTQLLVAESQELQRVEAPLGSMMTFNIEHGYLEAYCRSMAAGFIKDSEYKMLTQCENLDDFKLNLGDTDYSSVLQNQAVLTPSIIHNLCQYKFIDQFNSMRSQAVGACSTFLEFITYTHLIDSIQYIIKSIIKGNSDPDTLIANCHPLGHSPHLRHILVFDKEDFKGQSRDNQEDAMVNLYRTVLVETPVAPYFASYFSSQIKGDNDDAAREVHKAYSEGEIPIITAMIQKRYFEDFYSYCKNLGGETALIMTQLLEFEADRRALSIVSTSLAFKNAYLNEQSGRDLRSELFCSFGKLYLFKDSFKEVGDKKMLADKLQECSKLYYDLWMESESKNIPFTRVLAGYQAKLMRAAFDSQSHFACFYAFYKLKQQELDNIKYIVNCISMNRGQQDFTRIISTFEG